MEADETDRKEAEQMSQTPDFPDPPTLLLRVHSYRKQPLPDTLEARIGTAGGTLGRAPGNELVLDDPGKYISRVHARVSWRDGGYYLADEGVNPSIVDDRPLSPGSEAALADGTRIVLGDYALVALLEAPPQAFEVAAADATTLLPPPFEPPPPPPPPAPLPVFEPPAAPLAARELGPSDALAGARILDGEADGAGADPLGLNLFGSIGRPEAPAHPAFRGAESDHGAPQLQVFAMPSAPAPAMAIPDGYDPLADLMPAAAPSAPAVAAPVPEPMPVPVPAPVAPPVAAAPPGDAGGDAVLAALLDGLGLPQLATARAPEELAREVGRMLRAAVGGTIDVLMARTLTKRESRIDMTMIAPRANNPLKFFPDADSALTQMLGARLPGYLAPLDALAGAFDDLQAHELAVIAGMRAALAAVAQRFDPARIEQKLAAPGRLERLMPAKRKARLWERLVEAHAELARDADEDLQRLFGEKFSKAYEEQVERLRRERA